MVKGKHIFMVVLIITIVGTTTFIFSLNLAKAKHVYQENVVLENVVLFDATVDEKTIFYAYVVTTDIIIEERTFAQKITTTETISSETRPDQLSLFIFEKELFLVYSIENNIYCWTNNTKKFVVPGTDPQLFANADSLFIAWLDTSNLYVKPLENELATWLLATNVDEYAIYSNGKTYFTYTKSSEIYFRIFVNGFFGDEQITAVGKNPRAITTTNMTYLFHEKNGLLGVYYGLNDVIQLIQETNLTVNEIISYHDIIAFTNIDGLFFQRITDDGFSAIYQLTVNPATSISCFFADETNIMFHYIIEKRVIFKFAIIPEITQRTIIPVLEIISSKDLLERNAFQFISDYNTRNIQSTGSVKNFILAHSGESLIFLGAIAIVLVLVIGFFAGKRPISVQKKTIKR